MTLIVTCPHCGKRESHRRREDNRHQCSFCKQPLTPDAVAPLEHPVPRYGNPSDVTKATLVGGGIGAAILVVVTILFQSGPTTPAILAASTSGDPALQSLAWSQVRSQLVTLTISAGIGFAAGSLLGAVLAVALRPWPRLRRLAELGCISGALVGPVAVVLVGILPMAFKPDVSQQQWQAHLFMTWCWAISLALAGAVAGMVILPALGFAIRSTQ